MLMRVSIGIHKHDIESAIETYNLMSERWFTHASPTLFNSGTPKPQLSSCFLLTMKDDSIEGIYDTLKQTAMISKNAGGIGVNVHCIRATGSYISGTNGCSNGLVPMLKVYNETANYVDQGMMSVRFPRFEHSANRKQTEPSVLDQAATRDPARSRSTWSRGMRTSSSSST